MLVIALFFSTLLRKIIFGDIFADKMAVLSRNPIPNAAHRHLNVSTDVILLYIN